jgi:rubrerythrin
MTAPYFSDEDIDDDGYDITEDDLGECPECGSELDEDGTCPTCSALHKRMQDWIRNWPK